MWQPEGEHNEGQACVASLSLLKQETRFHCTCWERLIRLWHWPVICVKQKTVPWLTKTSKQVDKLFINVVCHTAYPQWFSEQLWNLLALRERTSPKRLTSKRQKSRACFYKGHHTWRSKEIIWGLLELTCIDIMPDDSTETSNHSWAGIRVRNIKGTDALGLFGPK